MIKITKLLKISLLLFFSFIMVISFPTKSNAEDSLGITSWIVESQLLENGDLAIEEDITFDFRKYYNGVIREIILEGTSGIEDIRVLEMLNGKEIEYNKAESAQNGDREVFIIKDESGNGIIQVFTPSEDEEKTFRIIYTVKNVAKKYNDVGELYYKFLGNENETPIDFFAVNIVLPQKDINNEVKIFAHGPLNGQIKKKTDRIVNLQVRDVPRNTYIEGRILFPEEFILMSKNTIDKDGYSNIMNEETLLQNEIEEKEAKKQAWGSLLGSISMVVAIIEIVIFFLLMIRFRRENNLFESKENTIIPDDCTPGVASYITSTVINSNVIISTILDLYRKGYLRVDDGEEYKKKKKVIKDFTITKEKDEDNNLLSHEKHFINWLINHMGDGKAVTTQDIEDFSKEDSTEFSSLYYQWQQKIKEDAIDKGYFDKSSKKYGIVLILLFSITLVLSIVTIILNSLSGLPLIGTSILLLVYGITLIFRRSDYGHSQYKKWTDFKKHMKEFRKDDFIDDFSKYPQDISLIYALALGIDKKIINKLNIDKNYVNSGYSYNYGWVYWYFLLNNDKNNVFDKSINNSFGSVSNPSTGSGGGFSGGGGGGAGGGGAGGF